MLKLPNLSPRLQTVCDMVPPVTRVADIGTDHGYIPITLAAKYKGLSAIAADVNEGPLNRAKANIRAYGLGERITLRLGDGLDVLSPGEVEGAVIAGMGGMLMASMLKGRADIVSSLRFLVLQPNLAQDEVRKTLIDLGWRIEKERLAKEEDKFYQVILAKPGKQEVGNRILTYEVGEKLLDDPLFELYLRQKISQTEEILEKLKRSKSKEALERKISLAIRLAEYQRILSVELGEEPCRVVKLSNG